MTAEPALQIRELPDAGAYRIDPERSGVTYVSRHMFGLGTVHAAFRVSSGLLYVSSTLAKCRASATVDAASFTSASGRRDRDVKGRSLLNVAAFPGIRFSSTGVSEETDAIVLAGIVAMHDVATAVQVKILSWEAPAPGWVHVTAQATHLDRYSFGITGSRGLVGRYFDLAFRIVAVRSET